ncbi:unnamed protein product [Ixodes hexagonus]
MGFLRTALLFREADCDRFAKHAGGGHRLRRRESLASARRWSTKRRTSREYTCVRARLVLT